MRHRAAQRWEYLAKLYSEERVTAERIRPQRRALAASGNQPQALANLEVLMKQAGRLPPLLREQIAALQAQWQSEWRFCKRVKQPASQQPRTFGTFAARRFGKTARKKSAKGQQKASEHCRFYNAAPPAAAPQPLKLFTHETPTAL